MKIELYKGKRPSEIMALCIDGFYTYAKYPKGSKYTPNHWEKLEHFENPLSKAGLIQWVAPAGGEDGLLFMLEMIHWGTLSGPYAIFEVLDSTASFLGGTITVATGY